ncbi:MAG: T9SS type A sorting domain-containing protein [Bacteroidetes bacterium]|nr:T9SS type A sorting domain-containing protein [Bacteroidota bacterium]
MKKNVFILYFLLACFHSSIAQLTRYRTYGYYNGNPHDICVYNDTMYFTSLNPYSRTNEIGVMDGNSLHLRGFANTAGMSLNFSIVGGKGDSLILLLHSYPVVPHMQGIFAYNLRDDSLHLLVEQDLFTQTARSGIVMLDNNKIYYLVKSPTGITMCRYDIAKGKTTTFCTLPINLRTVAMIYSQRNYYISLETVVGSSVTSDIYKVDTINKKPEITPITQGIGTSFYSPMVDFYGDLYFFGQEAVHGKELYKYSGSGSPVRVTDMNTNSLVDQGSSVSLNSQLAVYNNKLYFSGCDGIQANNGSLFEYNAGLMTTRLLYTNNQEFAGFNPFDYFVFHNRLYMSGCYGATTPPNAVVYDGTSAPSLIRRLNLGDPYGFAYTHKEWTPYKGNLYFLSNDTFQTISLYKFDDTILGPAPLLIAEDKYPVQVAVYPNPTSADASLDIRVQGVQSLHLQLIDMEGRLLYKKEIEGSQVVPLPMKQYVSGMYVYRLCNEHGVMVYSGRIIKQ